MAHVVMGTYSRAGEYGRGATSTAYNREAQGSPYYRDANTQMDYVAIHATNDSSSGPADYFPAIAGGISPVTDRFGALQLTEQAGLERPSSPTEHLRQAMKAVEVAESAIVQQIQENEHLRAELQLSNWELQNYKQETAPSRQPEANSLQASQKSRVGLPEKHCLEDPGCVPGFDKGRWPDNRSQVDSQGALVVHRSIPPEYNNHIAPPTATLSTSQNDSASSTLNSNPGGMNQGLISQATADCTGFSQISSPSSRSVSPNRFHREGDFESRPPLSGQALMQAPEISNQRSLWKQDLFLRVRAQEEEILQLRRRLTDYAIKELKILNEKHVLEKRIAGMRMAFDQQQQDLVDAASKALSYRHDIVEENVRLTYAFQAADQERLTFVSSLLPLLAEYEFQPAVNDAHSIISNVKVLIQHLHEKLNFSEAKLKDSQYHLTSWRADPVYQSPYPPQSPFHPNSDHSQPSKMNGLEIVPQTGYAQGHIPASPPSRGIDWDTSAGKYQHVNDPYHGAGHGHMSTLEPQSQANGPVLSSMFPSDEESTVPAAGNDPYSDNEVEETTGPGYLRDKDQALRDTAQHSPHLPPLPEEHSSISEEDDPLPAIENFQIVGDAVPGNTLQACGISINGTSLCVFQWVRHLQDGTVHYIEGAAQPEYTITADDVDAWIAIECVPMDERSRKGKLVKVFANEPNKITCDPVMQEQIENYFSTGQAVFDVQLSAGDRNNWETATLTLKKSNYEIRSTKQRRVVINEKYTPDISITVPYGPSAQCVIRSSDGNVCVLSTLEDNLRLRDTLVLTMRLFQKQALEKRKGKRKVRFFNKIVSGSG